MSSSDPTYHRGAVAAHDAAASSSNSAARASSAQSQSHQSQAGQQARASAARSATAAVQPGAGGPRRVRLAVSRVDPWSVMKLSFLLSVAIGVALVVAAAVLWMLLDAMGVFGDVNGVIREVVSDKTFDIGNYVGLGKVVSLATVIAVVDVVLITAICTLGAFLYNIASSLVGGLHVTLSDE